MTQNKKQIDALFQSAVKILKPPLKGKLSDWAEQNFNLQKEFAPEPGLFSCERFPPQRGVLDALGDPQYQVIVMKFSTQVGKSTLGYIMLAHGIVTDPGPAMIFMPTIMMAEGLSKKRIKPMIRGNPCLNDIFSDKSRHSGDTILEKHFLNGSHLTLSGANSPASLASNTVRYMIIDEPDRYPQSAGHEGDPVELAMARTENYMSRRKVAIMGSPTIEGESRIDSEYQASDQCVYEVPCPECGHYQTLRWENLKWVDNQPETVAYACEKCGVLSDESHKQSMLENGRWVASRPFTGIKGFHINRIYSPWSTWESMVKTFLKVKSDPEKLQTFVNTSLAETFRRHDHDDKMDYNEIMERSEEYSTDPIPDDILIITAGVDIQDDWIEYEIMGTGLGEETWSLEHGIIQGSFDNPAVRDALNDVFDQTFNHKIIGSMPIKAIGIDTGGSHTDTVYRFVGQQSKKHRIFALKGASTYGKPIASKGSIVKKYKIRLFLVGTDTAKDLIFERLGLTDAGARYCHFPITYSEDYFKGLCSEKKIITYSAGRKIKRYEKLTASTRNEPLDCRVYNMAALYLLNPKYEVLHKRMLAQQDKNHIIINKKNTIDTDKISFVKNEQMPIKRTRSRIRGSGFVNG